MAIKRHTFFDFLLFEPFLLFFIDIFDPFVLLPPLALGLPGSLGPGGVGKGGKGGKSIPGVGKSVGELETGVLGKTG